MKNHFYISYAGNKRQEVKTIYDTIDFTNIKTIVEPFAGTSAMSFYISTQQKNLNYVLNDNNEYLYDMFNIIRVFNFPIDIVIEIRWNATLRFNIISNTRKNMKHITGSPAVQAELINGFQLEFHSGNFLFTSI